MLLATATLPVYNIAGFMYSTFEYIFERKSNVTSITLRCYFPIPNEVFLRTCMLKILVFDVTV